MKQYPVTKKFLQNINQWEKEGKHELILDEGKGALQEKLNDRIGAYIYLSMAEEKYHLQSYNEAANLAGSSYSLLIFNDEPQARKEVEIAYNLQKISIVMRDTCVNMNQETHQKTKEIYYQTYVEQKDKPRSQLLCASDLLKLFENVEQDQKAIENYKKLKLPPSFFPLFLQDMANERERRGAFENYVSPSALRASKLLQLLETFEQGEEIKYFPPCASKNSPVGATCFTRYSSWLVAGAVAATAVVAATFASKAKL
jgi:hypothetical protein